MIAERWLVIILFLFIFGLIFNSPDLLAFTASISLIYGMASWWKLKSLKGVVYKRSFYYKRGFPGEKFPFRIDIENRKFLPLSWVRIKDPWPLGISPDGKDVLAPGKGRKFGTLVHAVSLRWFEKTTRSYLLNYSKRGIYKVGPPIIESGDLFGILDNEAEINLIDTITVYPELMPALHIDIPKQDPFGDSSIQRGLVEDQNRYIGVRDYRPEDSFRQIHWPATARTGQTQVKIYQPVASQVMVLCLNASTTKRYWEGVYPDLLEHMISLAATIIQDGISRGYRVGMISNGCLANSDQPFRIRPGRSPDQFSTLLQSLAGITPLVTYPFEHHLITEMPYLPYGSSLIILTAITSSELAETILHIKRHERKITLISLGQDAPRYLPGVACIHLPFTINQAITAVKEDFLNGEEW